MKRPARPNRRYVSLALPRLSTDRLARERWGLSWIADGRPDAPPLVVTDLVQNAQRLVAVEPFAEMRGLAQGQTLTDARALCPDLDAVSAKVEADRAFLHAIAVWCDRYTPMVALSEDAPGPLGLMLDITGCAHLMGGEAALLDDLEARLRTQGVHAATGCADTQGAAWALARHAPPCRVAS
ncbi:MAG: DNA polymerase Y family protein [Pseudomonadota bacterium]